jgi:monovalent cation:proton antiporter-2 (CPA2) family protein
MNEGILLLDIFYYFLATTVCVPLFKMMKLGSVIGYLVAGLFLGPSGLSLLHHASNIEEISQIGIIILLFVIGLELSPARLKHMQKSIWGVGTVQFIATTAVFFAIISMFDISLIGSFLIACALSLSSTAFTLTYLKDTNQITKSYGQSSFGILIFQDLIIIPLLTIVPLITNEAFTVDNLFSFAILKNLLIVTASIVIGKFTLPPVLSLAFQSQSKEIFIGTCLMLVIGSALLMEYVGLSKALGAFVAGILLSDSNFRTEIQSFSITLKSMLMGVFFMGIGLGFDLTFFIKNISTVLLITATFMSTKYMILMLIGRVTHKSWSSGIRLGGILCQGGEFGLLLLSVTASSSIFSSQVAGLVSSSVTLSIFLAPFIVKLSDYLGNSLSTPPVETNNLIALPGIVLDNKVNDKKAA